MKRPEEGAKTHLALIGYRGSGKTTVGTIVASHLERPLIDTDRAIETEAGRTIAEIFGAEGESGFRQREAALIERIAASSTPSILALGGGAIVDPATVAVLRRRAFVVWLDAHEHEIRRRISGDPNTPSSRPSLTGASPLEEIETVLTERRPLYRDAADLRLSADGDPMTIAGRIVEALRDRVRTQR